MVASSFCSLFPSSSESKFISSMSTQLHFSVSFIANAVLTVLLLRKGNVIWERKKAQSKVFSSPPRGAYLQIRFGNLWETLAGQLKRITFYLTKCKQKCFLGIVFWSEFSCCIWGTCAFVYYRCLESISAELALLPVPRDKYTEMVFVARNSWA